MTVALGPRISSYDAQSWRDLAACATCDTDDFVPVGSTGPAKHQIDRAKVVCATCPVQARCLEFAITTNQEHGVWGGADEDERRDLRRQWRRRRRHTA